MVKAFTIGIWCCYVGCFPGFATVNFYKRFCSIQAQRLRVGQLMAVVVPSSQFVFFLWVKAKSTILQWVLWVTPMLFVYMQNLIFAKVLQGFLSLLLLALRDPLKVYAFMSALNSLVFCLKIMKEVVLLRLLIRPIILHYVETWKKAINL